MGCKEAFPLAKKSAHERDCPFLQLKCPFHGQCAFNGALADVVPHLASEHQVRAQHMTSNLMEKNLALTDFE